MVDTCIFFASYVPKNEYINNWSKVTKINIDGINFISSLKKNLKKKIIFHHAYNIKINLILKIC